MGIEGIWSAELLPQTRPGGLPQPTPLFTLIIRAEPRAEGGAAAPSAGARLVLEMRDGRGPLLAASAIERWRGVATAGGARFEMPVRYRLGGRSGDFRLPNLADEVRAAANGRGLVRRLDLTLGADGERLDGAWSDHWYITEYRDGATRLTDVVPRPARLSATRADGPISWVEPASGRSVERVVSGTLVQPRALLAGNLPAALDAVIEWPGGRRTVPLATDASLARGQGPTLAVRAVEPGSPAGEGAGAPANGPMATDGIVIRVAPGAAITVRCLGRSATLIVDARETRRTLTITGLQVHDGPARRRWADATASILSLRDDREGSLATWRQTVAERADAQAAAEAEVDRAVGAVEAANTRRAALVAALEARVSALRATSPLTTYEAQRTAAEASVRRALARRAGETDGADAPVRLLTPPAPGALDAAIAQGRADAAVALGAIMRYLDDDAQVKALSGQLEVHLVERERAAKALGEACARERAARDALRAAIFDMGIATTAAELARSRADGLDGAGPRLARVRFTTSDGPAFDAGTAPDPAIVAHFRALLEAAEADVRAWTAERDDVARLADTADVQRAASDRRMLDAFYEAQGAGLALVVLIRRNTYLRLGLHVTIDVGELGKAFATDGWAGLLAEAAGKILGDWMSDTDDEIQTFDESGLRAQFEAIYAEAAAAGTTAAETTTVPRGPPPEGAADVLFATAVDPAAVRISVAKNVGLAIYQTTVIANDVVPTARRALRRKMRQAKRLTAALEQASRGGGFLPRQEVVDGMRRNVAAFGGLLASRERELAEALAGTPPDASLVGAARRRLARARVDYDDAVGTLRALQRRLKVDTGRLSRALKQRARAGRKLRDARAARAEGTANSRLRDIGKGIAIDLVVAFGKQLANDVADGFEADAWLEAFETELLYAIAARDARAAHSLAWIAEEARVEVGRALQAAERRRDRHRQRLEAYLAERAPVGGDLPVRLSAPFSTDAGPLTLTVTEVGGAIGYDCLVARSDTPSPQTPLVQRPAPTSTVIPAGPEVAPPPTPGAVVLGAARFEERFEEGDRLTLDLTIR